MNHETDTPYNKCSLRDKHFAVDHLHDTFLDKKRMMMINDPNIARKIENIYSRKRRMGGHFIVPHELRASICINQHGVMCNATITDLCDIYSLMYSYATKPAEEKMIEVVKFTPHDIGMAYGLFALAFCKLPEMEQARYQRAFNLMSAIPKEVDTFVCTK